MRWAISAVLSLSLPALSRAAAAPFDYRKDARQIVLVAAESVDGIQAKISLFEKAKDGWRQVERDIPAVIGKKGIALGEGLAASIPAEGLPKKHEGDLKSPAGVFLIGDTYGYAPKAPGFKLKYTQTLDSFEGVDDPASKFYNRIVDTRDIASADRDWHSHETMRRKDDQYKWLAVIRHNDANVPGDGSLIFMHIWRDSEHGTAGCTAMAEPNLLKVLRWLDPAKRPVVVQLPTSSVKAFWEELSHPAR